MKKVLIFFILLLVTKMSYASVITNFEKPFQATEHAELYENHNLLEVDLVLQHEYYVEDRIFIVPYKFYGESEIYTLGFYVDMSDNLETNIQKNNLRAFYQFSLPENTNTYVTVKNVIPEPLTTMAICFIALLILRPRHHSC